MTPAEIAKQLRGDSFQEEVEAFMLTGYVIATPDAFLLTKPVPYGAKILGPWDSWPAEDCSAWYVWLGTGSVKALLDLMPFPLPWCGFHRQDRGRTRIRWVETERLRARLGP